MMAPQLNLLRPEGCSVRGVTRRTGDTIEVYPEVEGLPVIRVKQSRFGEGGYAFRPAFPWLYVPHGGQR